MTLKYASSRSSRIKVHRANQMPTGGFLSDLFWVQHCICLHIRDIWWVLWPRFKMVQGHPRSKFMLPIVAHGRYPIRFLLTTTSYLWPPFFKYLMCNFDDLELGQFKIRSWCQSEAHWWFPIWPPLCLTLYLSRYLWHFMRKFCDLHLKQFKVIQGQRSWCQSVAHGWFRIRLLLAPIIVSVIILEIFDVQFWWPWTRIVHGHPRSMVIVLIGSPLVVYYMTHIVSNIVSLTSFQIFNVKALWPRSKSSKVKGHAASGQPMGYILFDFYWPHHRTCHHF